MKKIGIAFLNLVIVAQLVGAEGDKAKKEDIQKNHCESTYIPGYGIVLIVTTPSGYRSLSYSDRRSGDLRSESLGSNVPWPKQQGNILHSTRPEITTDFSKNAAEDLAKKKESNTKQINSEEMD